MITILKGNIIYSSKKDVFSISENSYLVAVDHIVEGVYTTLPKQYNDIAVTDYGDQLIIPGFVDVHVHAPQYENLGLGYDQELLPWLETYTFPEEAKYEDCSYAETMYDAFTSDLKDSGTTRAIIFGTVHKQSTLILARLLQEKGLGALVGKVNMDRNSADALIEDTKQSIEDTQFFIEQCIAQYSLVKPIITPRFVPTCTASLLQSLGQLALEHNLCVQSHLSENKGEIAWVKELHPECATYGDVYDTYRLFGQQPTIMAHCVYSDDSETALMKKNNVFVAHCPDSNIDLSSGIAPIRKYLNQGIAVGLGTDISGGHSLFMPRAIVAAIQSSKLYNIFVDPNDQPLNTAEAFYLATKAGGTFFNTGSFEKGFILDALVIDDHTTTNHNKRTIEERLQKFLYTGSKQQIKHIYADGKKIK